MKYHLRQIEDLPVGIIRELLRQYNDYIIEFFEEELHLEEQVPVDIDNFFKNDFLGYAEEELFSWKIHDVLLKYSYKKVHPDHIDITTEGLVFQVRVPTEIFEAHDREIRKYIEEHHGESIFNLMVAEQL